MERDAQEAEYRYLSSRSGSLTWSCTSAILAAISLVAIPFIGFFVALVFVAIALGFWRRYLSGLPMSHSNDESSTVPSP
ncbi:MAG: hypothetical protein ACXADO_08370 [Candidatus Thorarchaeota archaeon]|jgi:hypothetical protein